MLLIWRYTFSFSCGSPNHPLSLDGKFVFNQPLQIFHSDKCSDRATQLRSHYFATARFYCVHECPRTPPILFTRFKLFDVIEDTISVAQVFSD